MTKPGTLRADLLLLLAAAIWGFAFVAQRAGMEHLGPFVFNGVRFALGASVLIPFLARRHRAADRLLPELPWRGGALAGLFVFAGASLQQIGIVTTTAGNAGFITGLYVIIVPILGLLLGQRTRLFTWVGAGLAVIGLFLLTVTEQLTIARGDLLVLIGAFFWAGHVLLIGRLMTRSHPADPAALAFCQFAVCSLLSLLVGGTTENFDPAALRAATVPILYAGILSVGVAYTLQVVAQQQAPPSHAAIILSLEAVFAVLGGVVLLSETMSGRGLAGCVLMLTGMIISQRRPQS